MVISVREQPHYGFWGDLVAVVGFPGTQRVGVRVEGVKKCE